MNITAAGMVCPVGLNSRAACAAIRAGVSIFSELPYWDKEKETVIGCRVPGLDELQFGPRLLAMLVQALRECVTDVEKMPWQEVPLLIGLAEPGRPGGGDTVAASIVDDVQAQLGVPFHRRLSKVLRLGHTAAFEALRTARDLLNRGDVPACLIAGVDSYINASALYWLDECYRLKRAGHMDGVIPGEAAAVVLVERQPRKQANAGQAGKAPRAIEVVGLGFGHEKATILDEEPLLGLGLADAARGALADAGWGFHDLDFRLSDVTGENYGFREHTLAEARLVTKVRTEPQPIWHAAECIGDTGAAAGAVQLVVARAAMLKQYAPGPRVLCFTSALPGNRAVAAVQGRDHSEAPAQRRR